ncbi:MAG: hypothetical protein QXM16_06725 [Nitrososphaerota archaeon]
MAQKLKKQFIELLEKDVEFRYTVAGYLGLSEIIKRLDTIEQEIKRLWEGQNKLWEEVKSLREGLNKLWESHMRLEKYVRTGFEGLRKALHITFEDYSRSFTQLLLEELGYGWREVDRKILVSEGRPVEIDIFCEEPLVMGEATSILGSWEDAEKELAGLEERVRLVSTLYGKSPELMLFCVGRAAEEVVPRLRKVLDAKGVRLVLGSEIKEAVV